MSSQRVAAAGRNLHCVRAFLPLGFAASLFPMAVAPDALLAQEPRTGLQWAVDGLPLIGGSEEDYLRLSQLWGHDADGFLFRSPSRLAAALDPPAVGRISFLSPTISTHWNSDIPDSSNEALAWSGRGWNTVATAGFRARVGPLSIVLAPQFAYSENREFDFVRETVPGRSEYSLHWFTDTLSIDLPIRFGQDPLSTIDPGQSSVYLSLGPVTVGAGTENHWWGPGVRNAIVLSNNAPGFPHASARSTSPIRTPIGDVEWVWLAGKLEPSEFFRNRATAEGDRSLSAFGATFRPGGGGLTLGIARAVYAPLDGGFRDAVAEAPSVLLDWTGSDEMERDGRDVPSEQLLSLFGRWVLPTVGGEVYAEWARYRLPLSVRDLLTQPNHTQGYTVGMQLVRPVANRLNLRLQAEATNLERSATYRLRPIGSYYSSRMIPEGYTNRGKVVGAAIGPGSSSQWLATDLLSGAYRLGLFGGRVRWYNDAYFRRPAPWLFLGHDVSLLGGVRAGTQLGPWRWDAELYVSKRYNFLFQNQGISWETADNAVDIVNRSLRVTISPAGRAPRP